MVVEETAAAEAVIVAVHLRPLIEQELEQGCAECLGVTPGATQICSGPHSFTFDHVFGGDCGHEPVDLYGRCVAPLVDGLFKGYNATVFAYGQTGSGKTYTMGSAFPQEPGSSDKGVIPLAMDAIFNRIAQMSDVAITVRVGFVEIHKEEIRDLISQRQANSVHIRELPNGGIVLAGAAEREVSTKDEMIRILEKGTSLRATGETGMNKRSSRSHAIFTITVEMRKLAGEKSGAEGRPRTPLSGSESDPDEVAAVEDDDIDSYLCAKMHLVDLAGSERAKRTKAQGQRMQEGIHINKGLLALGNVINALSEGKPHVPYRDSKLTRMLQDSLGGNSRTVMVACVSPADVNLEESLNTLRYASRARAIKNKPVVNRDPVAAQIAALRQQLAAAKAENLDLRRRLGLEPTDELEELERGQGDPALGIALDASNNRVFALESELAGVRAECEELRQELRGATEAQFIAAMQRDKVAQALEAVAGPDAAAAALAEAKVPPGQETVERALASRVQELEDEVRHLRLAGSRNGTPLAGSPYPASPLSPSVAGAMSPFSESGGEVFAAEEREHVAEMARVQSQLDVLQQQLENKEAAIKAVSGHAAMRATFENQLREVAAERDGLAKERSDLLAKLRQLQTASNEERVRLERAYKERIRDLDMRVKVADKKERKIRELEATRARAMETVNRLEGEIQSIKSQKASLQRQTEKAAKEFTAWRKERDREVMHLKKTGRQNAAQMMRMEALQAKQGEVLRRKTEEAAAARKRLQLLEGRRTGRAGSAGTAARYPSTSGGQNSSAQSGGVASPMSDGTGSVYDSAGGAAGGIANALSPVQPNPSAPMLRDEPSRREWVESELDSCCSLYELQRVLEGEKALRSEAARQLREVERRLAALKNPQWWGASSTEAGKFGEEALVKKRTRLAAAAEKHGRQIQEVQLALVQARAREEERGGGAADAKRWASLPAPPEVRAVMTTVFRSASQYKAQAYEAQLALTELSEEVEMLRLRLEVAEAERLEMAMREESMLRRGGDMDTGTPAASVQPDATDTEAASVLEQLNSLSAEDPSATKSSQRGVSGGRAPPSTTTGDAETPGGGGDVIDEIEEADTEEEDDWEEEEGIDEIEDSGSEEDEDSWDPSKATPWGGKSRRRREETGGTGAAPEEEHAVLVHLNAAKTESGEEPLEKLTVAALRGALKGKVLAGQEWKAGGKKRAELVADYLQMVAEAAQAAAIAGTPGKSSISSLQAVGESPASVGSESQPAEKKSPFSQLKGAFRKSMRSESSGELKSPVSRSGSLRSLAARALGGSRSSSGLKEVASLVEPPDDGFAFIQGGDPGEEASTYDVLVPEMKAMALGNGGNASGPLPTTSSGSANSGASGAGGKRTAQKPVWVPG